VTAGKPIPLFETYRSDFPLSSPQTHTAQAVHLMGFQNLRQRIVRAAFSSIGIEPSLLNALFPPSIAQSASLVCPHLKDIPFDDFAGEGVSSGGTSATHFPLFLGRFALAAHSLVWFGSFQNRHDSATSRVLLD